MFSMAPIVGYLPQHLAELSVVGALFVIPGIYVVIVGHVSEEWDRRFGAWGARGLGAGVALVGLAIAVSSFIMNAGRRVSLSATTGATEPTGS